MVKAFARPSTLLVVVGMVACGLLAPGIARGAEPTGGTPVDEAGALAEKATGRATYADTRALIDAQRIPEGSARASADREISCAPEAFPEGESNCGLGSNGQPNDTLDGGCSSQNQYFFPTFCGDLICGTSAWNGAARDTDWYELTIFSQQTLTWEVTPDFDAYIGLAGGTNGVPDCQLVSGINPFRLVPRGETDSVSVCLGPGTWWFVVIPDTNQAPFSCGRRYEASLTCASGCPMGACCLNGMCDNGYEPAECTAIGGVYMGNSSDCAQLSCMLPANDDCSTAQTIVPGEDVVADLRLATVDPNKIPPCAGSGGVGSVWYKFTGNGAKLRLSTCASEGYDDAATDSVIAVYAGSSCNSLNYLTCNDDAGCGGTGRLSSLCTFTTQPGTTYYIQVLAWSEDTRGLYLLETDFPCSTSNPVGACCIPTPEDPICDDVDEASCANFGGRFEGEGTACSTADCAGVEFPDNDDCAFATYLALPGSDIGDTTFAQSDLVNSNCGLEVQSAGVWYRVLGTGNTITADMCNANTLFDARLHVYCADCGQQDWTCVGASDDGIDEGCGTKPSVSWCSEEGSAYFILVSGTGGATGNYQISVTDDGTPCDHPAVCDSNCEISCPPGATSENEGFCSSNYVDSTNGGCGADPPVFGTIVPGETICGTSGTFPKGTGRGRDVDWFHFSIQQQCDVTWTVHADFMVETYILNNECGAGLASYAEAKGNACQDVVVRTTLEPGDYSILLEPQFFEGIPCASSWYGTLECDPTPNNGACCLDENTCIETSEAYCISLGGGYGEDGVACANADCTPVNDCPSDFDGSGYIDVFDFARISSFWGSGPNATHDQGDANGDGWVDVFDFAIFSYDFDSPCP